VIARLPDWEARLSAYLEPLLFSARFAWGVCDCAIFSADAVRAMTGHDCAAAFRGRYSTSRGSARALNRFGAGSLKATLDSLLPAKPVGFAQRGDVVMHDGAAGICMGAFAFFVGQSDDQEGLVRVARAEWSHAWGVGA
jgi:hypothetical protein